MSGLFWANFLWWHGAAQFWVMKRTKGNVSRAFSYYLTPSSPSTCTCPALVSVRAAICIAGVGLCLPKCCAGQKRAKECQLHGRRQVHRGLLLLALLRTREDAFDSPKEGQFYTPRVQHPKSRGIHLSWKTLGKFCCGNFESLLIMHTQFKWYVLPSALLPQQVCLQVASFCTLSRAGNLISFISCSFVHIYG